MSLLQLCVQSSEPISNSPSSYLFFTKTWEADGGGVVSPIL